VAVVSGYKKRLPKKPCAVCGTKFHPYRSTSKFCSRACASRSGNEGRARARPGTRYAEPKPTEAVVASATEADLIAELQSRGHRVIVEKPTHDRRIRIAPKKTRHHRFAVMGDTHLGSRYQQLTHLHAFYDKVAKEGIDTVFHVGDLVDGSHKMHRDAIFEQFVHGFDGQVDYAVENYPRRDGIKTLLITGNHDDSFHADSGADAVAAFCNRRDDTEYLGQRGVYLEFGGITIYLWHPTGGAAYARSYKMQKLIEAMAPENKPHMLFCGHWHVPEHTPALRNVECFMTPCFQGQSYFLKTKGLSPVVGGLIIDLWTDDQGLNDLRTRWCIERVPVPDDH
jgi:predicted phosphodiesterase